MNASYSRSRGRRTVADSEEEAEADNEEEEDSSEEEESDNDRDTGKNQSNNQDYFDRQWMEKYKALKSYKQKHGDVAVPSTGKLVQLHTWVIYQRRLFRKNKMQNERKKLLDKLGFIWDPTGIAPEEGDNAESSSSDNDSEEAQDQPTDRYERKWLERYQSMKLYKKNHGHMDIPSTGKDTGLYQWALWQRRMFRQKKISKERKRLLDRLGFYWGPGITAKEWSDDVESSSEEEEEDKIPGDKYAAQWMEKYEELKSYKRKHGNLNLPSTAKETISLYQWTVWQRRQYRENRLTKEREKLLLKLGFVLVPGTEAQGGSVDESSSKEEEEDQATHNKQPRQNSYYQAKWMANYEKLKKHKKKNGHLVVSSSKEGKNEPLYFWVIRQRKLKERNELPEDREILLNKLGFFDDVEGGEQQSDESDDSTAGDDSESSSGISISDSSSGEIDECQSEDEGTWTKRYERLKTYSKNYGCVTVPYRYGDGFESLALWSRKQRRALEEERLPKSRKRKLDKLGFYWRRHASVEDGSNSDSDASDNSEAANTNGGDKVGSKGRVAVGDTNTSAVQQQLQITVAKTPSQAQQQKWLQGYENLKEYKAKFGNLDIRNRDQEYRSLYTWVTRQRRMHWEQTLTTERQKLLDAIDFPWQQQHPSESQKIDEVQTIVSMAAQDGEFDGLSERKRNLTNLPIFTSNQPHDQGWVEQFRRLQKLKRKFGTMEIQYKDFKRKSLYNWIWRQRKLKREKKLPSDRMQLLDSIGFDWIGNKDAGNSDSETESENGESQQGDVRDSEEDSEDEASSPGSNMSPNLEARIGDNEIEYEFNGAGAGGPTNGAASTSGVPVGPDKIGGLKAYLNEVELQIEGKKKEIKHLQRKRARLERSV